MNSKAVYALLMALVLVGGLSGSAVAYTWYSYNGHSYALTQNWESWLNAEQEAVSLGGHLATINDAGENDWLASTFGNTYCQGYPGWEWCAIAWIGMYDTTGTSSPDIADWQWSSGEPVTYTNLYSMFPESGTHMYLHVNPHPVGPNWNAHYIHDVFAEYLPKGIIEISSIVPEPSTFLLACAGLMCAGLFRKKFKM